MGKIITTLIIVLVLLIAIFFIYQIATPQVSTGNVIKTETNQKCHSNYVLELFDTQQPEENNFEIELKFTNPNSVSLSIPCSLVISKTNFDVEPPVRYDKKSLKNWIFNIDADSKDFITKNFEMPEGYGNWDIECKDIDELPECN